jgi:antisense regulator of RalR protein
MAYKITATIIKEGHQPTSWTHFTNKKLTIKQCIEKLSSGKKNSFGRKVKEPVRLENFECARV